MPWLRPEHCWARFCLRVSSEAGEALKRRWSIIQFRERSEEIRKQPLGTAHTAEVGGTVTFQRIV